MLHFVTERHYYCEIRQRHNQLFIAICIRLTWNNGEQ